MAEKKHENINASLSANECQLAAGDRHSVHGTCEGHSKFFTVKPSFEIVINF